MEIHEIKEYILEHNCTQLILEELGCHHIKLHKGSGDAYYQFGNSDGDNPNAVTLYLCPTLNVINYTRPDFFGERSDLFTLVEYCKKINFFESVKYVCNLIGLDFYKNPNDDLTPARRRTLELIKMNQGITDSEDDLYVKPLPEAILSYYRPCVNDYWLKDHVPYEVQQEWELAYDECTSRIVIPVRDETGQLVGCKGRLFKGQQDVLEEGEQKYIYIEPCPRNKILYGLYKTYTHIKQAGRVYCFESEKAVHQLWAYGYKNAVSFGGKQIGKSQIDKLTVLDVEVVLCMDQDVSREEVEKIAGRFIKGVKVYAIFDQDHILGEKQSPSDCPEKWSRLVKNNLYFIR